MIIATGEVLEPCDAAAQTPLTKLQGVRLSRDVFCVAELPLRLAFQQQTVERYNWHFPTVQL